MKSASKGENILLEIISKGVLGWLNKDVNLKIQILILGLVCSRFEGHVGPPVDPLLQI